MRRSRQSRILTSPGLGRAHGLRAWHRLAARYARHGLGREPYESPADWTRRVSAARPQAAQALGSLSRRFADARYAPNEGDHRALIDDLRRHRP